MNKKALFAAALCLAIALLLSASASYAQVPQFVAAGSSAVFTETAIAAATGDPITQSAPRCSTAAAPHLWTSKTTGKNVAAGIDPRPGIPAEPGNIWIVWDQSPNPTTVCVFLSVDSIVGLRLLHAAAVGPTFSTVSLNNNLGVLNNCNVALAGDSAIPYFTDTEALPIPICQVVQGATITSAFSDIRAEDGEFANFRATTLGWAFGQAVQSAFNTASAQIQDFYINGHDPNTNVAVRATESVSIGAQVVLHTVNTGIGTVNPGDFGNLFTNGGNVLSRTIDLIYAPAGNGETLNHTVDVSGVRGVAGQSLNLTYREPVSGTYNTFEFQMPHEKGSDGSQEATFTSAVSNCFVPSGSQAFPVNTAANCHNPSVQVSNSAVRARAIGTGQVVQVLSNSHNAMGYWFWSFSNGRDNGGTVPTHNLRYLTVDGVDPLGAASPYNGQLPQCTGTINASNLVCPALTFPGVVSGNYRNWNIVRLLVVKSSVDAARNTFAKAFVAEIQDINHQTINDLVPVSFCSVPNLVTHTCTTVADGLTVFRSHYALPSQGADPVTGPWLSGNPTVPVNGTPASALPESGGDMAGAIFNDQSDVDFFADSGSTAIITGYIQ